MAAVSPMKTPITGLPVVDSLAEDAFTPYFACNVEIGAATPFRIFFFANGTQLAHLTPCCGVPFISLMENGNLIDLTDPTLADWELELLAYPIEKITPSPTCKSCGQLVELRPLKRSTVPTHNEDTSAALALFDFTLPGLTMFDPLEAVVYNEQLSADLIFLAQGATKLYGTQRGLPDAYERVIAELLQALQEREA